MTKHHTQRAMRLALCGSLSALLIGTATCAIAAGLWQASKVSGHAWMAAPGSSRTALQAGMAVPDGVTVFTDDRTRVMLVRGSEFMVVGPRSVLAVSPNPEPGMDTTVLQRAGTVTFDVAKQNAPHFSVETPILAAVVKGTHFTVNVSGARANVAVARGLVGVTNLSTGQSADISPGQRADAARGAHGGLSVSGTGSLPSITHGLPRASVVSTNMAVSEPGSFVATTSAATTQAPSAVTGAQGDSSSTSVSHAAGTSNSNRSGTPATSAGAPAASPSSSAIGTRSVSAGAGSSSNATASGGSGGSSSAGAGQSGSAGGNQGNGKDAGPGQSSGKGSDGKGNAGSAGAGKGAGAGNSGSGKAAGATGTKGGGLGSSAGTGQGKGPSDGSGSATESRDKGDASTGQQGSGAGLGSGAGRGNGGEHGNKGH